MIEEEKDNGLTEDNFEDGQYGMDNGMYDEEDDKFLEEAMDEAMKKKK